jgi:hypothetical protein
LSSGAVVPHVALFVGATIARPTSTRIANTQRFQAHKRQRPRMSICEALLTAHPFVLRKEVDLAQILSALRRVLDSLNRLNSLMSAVNQRGDPFR